MKGPEGNTYLADGGSSDVKKVGQYRLESFLKSQGVGMLDYMLISHGNSDHMNGVEELIVWWEKSGRLTDRKYRKSGLFITL